MQVQNKPTMLVSAISSQIVRRIQQNRNSRISLQTTRDLTVIKRNYQIETSGTMTERKDAILYTRIWTWCFRREI